MGWGGGGGGQQGRGERGAVCNQNSHKWKQQPDLNKQELFRQKESLNSKQQQHLATIQLSYNFKHNL